MKKFNLLVQYFRVKDEGRNKEYMECIIKNIDNIYLKNIFILTEQSDDKKYLPKNDKLKIYDFGKRASYNDFFNFANNNIPNSNIILSNLDIIIDETISNLCNYDLSKYFLCLTRWDLKESGEVKFYNEPGSQDTWIFSTPTKPINAKFFIGYKGCDNRIAYLAEEAGYIVNNPSKLIRTLHLHNHDYRGYIDGYIHDSVKGECILGLEPTTCLESNSKKQYNKR